MNKSRIERLNKGMQANGLDAVFISNPKNVQYLSGFHSMMPGEVQPFGDPEGFVLFFQNEAHLLCDGRYIAGARRLPGITAQLIESPTKPKTIADKIKSIMGGSGKVIGFERDALLYGDCVAWLNEMSSFTCKPAEEMLAHLRVIKTKDEIDLIRKAQQITAACFDHIAKWIRPGMSERQVALEIDNYLRTNSDGNSFNPIVGFGENSCNPHYTASPDAKLRKDQLVLLDFGSIYHGYCGDMTRMLVMGKADARIREVYDLVLQAQLRCLDGIKPGKTCHELDALCRDYFTQKGCAKEFMHGTGHGVGLAIHEDPRIKPGFTNKIEPGMVFTVEPGLYYVGWGGVRIEDMVAITETGFENLTTTSKELLELNA